MAGALRQVLLFYPDGKRSSSTENIQPQAVPAAVGPAGGAAAVGAGQPGPNPAAAPAPAVAGERAPAGPSALRWGQLCCDSA